MTVGQAIWPEQLTASERAQLTRGVPADLDRRPDVLIVGGGILGLATAVACTQAGLGSVVVLERDQLGSGASGGAAGLLAPEAHVGVDPAWLVELMRRSLQAWRELEAAWPGGVGLIETDWLGIEPVLDQFGGGLPPGAERVSAERVAGLVPGLAGERRGVLVRGQARVNPLRALARMAAGLPGVATGVDVRGVEAAHGRIAVVRTSAGDFRPGSVVFATGNPPRVDGLLLEVPWSEVKGHMLLTEPAPVSLTTIVASVATQLEDGRLLRGGTLDVGDPERIVRPEVIAQMHAELAAELPLARQLGISHQWACFRPAHPDHVPVVDRVPGVNNAWLTSGHYKTGILMAPGTGRALAEWIRSGDRPAHLDGLGVARFGRA